jgi:hypothetical protein
MTELDVVGNVERATKMIPALEGWGLLCCAELWRGAMARRMTRMTCEMMWMVWVRRMGVFSAGVGRWWEGEGEVEYGCTKVPS